MEGEGMKGLLWISLIALAVSGCAVKKDFYATGGSRADGAIDMAYDFRPFESPVVNFAQAETIATQKCGVWGYNRAEKFGGITQNCQARDGFGTCTAGQMIVKYQCIGNITPTQAASSYSAPAPTGMLTAEQYKATRLKALMEQNLPYAEYQKQYHALMDE